MINFVTSNHIKNFRFACLLFYSWYSACCMYLAWMYARYLHYITINKRHYVLLQLQHRQRSHVDLISFKQLSPHQHPRSFSCKCQLHIHIYKADERNGELSQNQFSHSSIVCKPATVSAKKVSSTTVIPVALYVALLCRYMYINIPQQLVATSLLPNKVSTSNKSTTVWLSQPALHVCSARLLTPMQWLPASSASPHSCLVRSVLLVPLHACVHLL